MELRSALTTAIGLPGTVTALSGLYLLGLAGAAFRHRDSAPASPTLRLVVLVPAHDEQALIARCLASLRAQDHSAHLVEIVVVADNCTDRTAAIAREQGCTVMERTAADAPGKGRALRWAMDKLLASPRSIDAIVVVDADSVADPGLLSGLAAQLGRGAEVVQGEYLVLDEGDGRAALRAAAFRLFHVTRFAGRAALGLPCSLVGNGMAFSRTLLERHPWNAFTGAEDLEFSTDLRLAGVRPAFAARARISAPAATRGSAGRTQRLRWEGGRLHVVRTRLPRLAMAALRRRDPWLLDAAIDLAIPPLGLLVMLAAGGFCVAVVPVLCGVLPAWVVVPWAVALAAIPAYVLVGLRAAQAPPDTYRALLETPAFLAAKVGTYLRIVRSGSMADRWERTERPLAPPTPSQGPSAVRVRP